jgi:alkylhydroperoxidase family enzyme
MAWIKMIDKSVARGRLKRLVDRMAGKKGKVDNILMIHSLNPPSMAGHYDLYKTLMYGRSPLSRAQREMIAVVVSTVNECHY